MSADYYNYDDQWAANGGGYTDDGQQGEHYQLQEQPGGGEDYQQGYGAVDGGEGTEYLSGAASGEPGNLFRSEEMALCQLFLQVIAKWPWCVGNFFLYTKY